MKLYLFAIGGSGARVVKSLVHLLAAGATIPSNAQIVPVLIDTDANSLETIKLNSLLEKYNSAQNVLYGDNVAERESGGFFAPSIKLEQFDFQDLNLDSTFNKFLNEYPGQKDQLSPEMKALISSLYDDSSENSSETELNLNLKVGFKGNPNIGSIIFNLLSNNKDYSNLISGIESKDRLFIISSIFGGNGSAGFPALLNLLDISDEENVRAAIKGALTVLPYYDLEVDQSEDNDTSINAKLFNSKSKAALSFYAEDSVMNNLNAHYYVADGMRGQYGYSPEGIGQKNPACFAEFVGALSILDFLNNEDAGDAKVKNGFALDMIGNGYGDNSVHLGHFQRDSSIATEVLNKLVAFGYTKKFHDNLINGSSISEGFKSYTEFFAKGNDTYRFVLDNYYEDWQIWIDELADTECGKRGLRFFNFDREIDEFIYASDKKNKFNMTDIDTSITRALSRDSSKHIPSKYIRAVKEYFSQTNLYQYPNL